ncbi:MAG: ATP-binding protein [Terriglobia bacterium]
MAAHSELIEATLESRLESVEKAEELATEVCCRAGFGEEEQHRIGMAVHESVINAVRHGNKSDLSKSVRLEFQVRPDRLVIHICDQGEGFDPGSIPDPLESENLLKVSGRGIFLIRAFVDEFSVRHTQGVGTEVTMVKYRSTGSTLDQGGRHREHEGKNAPR